MKSKVFFYLFKILLPPSKAVLPRGLVRTISHGSCVTAGRNRCVPKKPAMLVGVELDNTSYMWPTVPPQLEQDRMGQDGKGRNKE